jgi:ADP-ribosylglycohydrolase
LKSINFIIENGDWKNKPYDTNRGSGASMRCLTFAFFLNSVKKIIKYVYFSAKITHNNVFTFLGSLFYALLAYYIINKIGNYNNFVPFFFSVIVKNNFKKYIDNNDDFKLCIFIFNSYL